MGWDWEEGSRRRAKSPFHVPSARWLAGPSPTDLTLLGSQRCRPNNKAIKKLLDWPITESSFYFFRRRLEEIGERGGLGDCYR